MCKKGSQKETSPKAYRDIITNDSTEVTVVTVYVAYEACVARLGM